jgi:hypothetical protein
MVVVTGDGFEKQQAAEWRDIVPKQRIAHVAMRCDAMCCDVLRCEAITSLRLSRRTVLLPLWLWLADLGLSLFFCRPSWSWTFVVHGAFETQPIH